jgi:hypothetical protein
MVAELMGQPLQSLQNSGLADAFQQPTSPDEIEYEGEPMEGVEPS